MLSLLKYQSYLYKTVRLSHFFQTRSFRGRSKSDEFNEFMEDVKELFPESDPYGFGAMEDLEKMTDWVDVDTGTITQDLMKERDRTKTNVKKQIIKRKFFKVSHEPTLLTWAAKEQIRFLHAEYPDEWTVDKIATSFPITKDGVIRFLRSSYVPECQEDIKKHDRRVHKRWLELKDGKQDMGGPILNKSQHLLDGNIEKLKNAAGIRSLPLPSNTEDVALSLAPGQSMKQTDLNTKKGPFNLIYQAYADSQTAKSKISTKRKDKTEYDNVDSVKLLESIISSNQPKDKQKNLSVSGQKSDFGQKNHNVYRQKHTTNTRKKQIMDFTEKDDIKMESLYDVYNKPEEYEENSVKENVRKGRRLRNTRRRTFVDTKVDKISSDSTDIQEEHERLELKGTGRIENLDFMCSDKSNDLADSDTVDSQVFQRKINIPPEFIHVPKDKSSKGAIYQRGDCFYDEHGVFLYRLP